MHYEYLVELKRDNERYIDNISRILCMLSVLAFGFNQINTARFNFFLTFDALAVSAGLVLQGFRSRGNKPVQYKAWLLLSGLGWLAMPHIPWLAGLFLIFAFLEYQAKYPLQIGFGQDEVVINTLFKRKHAWTEFSNIILKDGLLTLDFKNNRIIQRESIEDEEPDAEEEEFNAYCRSRLQSVTN